MTSVQMGWLHHSPKQDGQVAPDTYKGVLQDNATIIMYKIKVLSSPLMLPLYKSHIVATCFPMPPPLVSLTPPTYHFLEII